MDQGEATGLTRAAEAFEEAGKLSPDFALLNQRRGLLALKQGQADLAEGYLRRQIQVDPYYLPALQQLTTLLVQQRRYTEARALLEQALPFFPDRADLRANLELLRGQK
jgi:Tfp pilus assembly protein PilF